MIKALAHVCLGAADLAAAERFYCGALGMRKVFDFVRGGQAVGFYAAAGNSGFIEVFGQGAAGAQDKCLIRHFCLEVENLAGAVARLRAAGVEVSDPKLGADGSWQAWTADPGGVRIEFHEYTEQSSQRTGRECRLG
jgi:catechol 2,3-dioxygenase-like lactoylglutathione lyase family enzyme